MGGVRFAVKSLLSAGSTVPSNSFVDSICDLTIANMFGKRKGMSSMPCEEMAIFNWSNRGERTNTRIERAEIQWENVNQGRRATG